MEIFVSAGEASSDIHCAQLIRTIKQRVFPVELKTFGLGGDRLAEQGCCLMMHNHEFSVGGGPLEVVSKLPKRRQLERLLEKRLFEKRPDGAILVDNGEINLRLASLLHFFGVPIVYFIPPKVWAWRHSRIETIAQHVDLVLSIFPFEEPIYREWNIPFQYIGNPLADEVSRTLTEDEAKQRLEIGSDTRVLTVMAGSRYNEVQYHTSVFADAIQRFIESLPSTEKKPIVLLPAAPAIDPNILRNGFEKRLAPLGIEVRAVVGRSHECLKAARAALVKSGTSTLEAALLSVPMVLAYQTSASSRFLYKHVVRYRGFVGMVNLFLANSPESALGWGAPVAPVVPELILERCNPDSVAKELLKIYLDGPSRDRMLADLSRTWELVIPPSGLEGSPLAAAANASLKVFTQRTGFDGV